MVDADAANIAKTYANAYPIFAYAFPMFATSPSTIMEAAFGRLHNNGGAAFGGPPIVVESIMVDGEVANIGKTYANMYRIFMYMYISHILIYFPYVIPGAISLAKSVCLFVDIYIYMYMYIAIAIAISMYGFNI